MEKLCDILFRIQHSRNSPSIVIHGDNLKKYIGDKTVDIEPRIDSEVYVQPPQLRDFTNSRLSRVSENVMSDNMESSDIHVQYRNRTNSSDNLLPSDEHNSERVSVHDEQENAQSLTGYEAAGGEYYENENERSQRSWEQNSRSRRK